MINDDDKTDNEMLTFFRRYNRYLAIAGRAVRRSLKEDKRLAAERRGQLDLRFSKWQVRNDAPTPTARADTRG